MRWRGLGAPHGSNTIYALVMKYCIALLLSASAATAFAGLGGAPSAPGPRILSNTSAPAFTPASSYTDLKKTLDSGTELHEYVNSNGTVFAVSWQGPYMPDLKEMLGTRFQDLLDHVRTQSRGARSQVRLAREDLVIYSGGRPGAFEGRAWIPALLPAGFDTGAIQ